MLTILSKAPLAFTHTDDVYREIIRELNKHLHLYTPEPFGFKSVASGYAEHSRYIVPLGELFQVDPLKSTLRAWTINFLPSFLSELYACVATSNLVVFHPDKIRMILRFRVLQDRRGYSLAPHRDSKDTIFAFLLQLSESNPTTSLFFRNNAKYRYRDPIIRANDQASVSTAIGCFFKSLYGYDLGFEISENQFGVSKFVAWDHLRTAWLVQVVDNEILLIKYDEQKLTVPYGSILAIHNPLSDFMFSSERTKYFQENCTHGFFPTSFDTRNLLLCDVLCRYSENEDDLIPNDPSPTHHFYVVLRKETTHDMLKNAGFIKK